MSFDLRIKKEFNVDGKNYDSLDQVPAEVRAAIEKAMQTGAPVTATVIVNGKTYASLEEVPAPLRAIIGALTSTRAEDTTRQVPLRTEPILSAKATVIGVVVAALLVWLASSMF